jgi:AcrR family transcriptional regulator
VGPMAAILALMSASLWDAATHQLCLVGADALTMEGIAERANVSIGWAYKSGTNLESLLLEAARAALPRAVAEIPDSGELPESIVDPKNRLALECVLSLRRFPGLRDVVVPTIEEWVARVGPLRASVILGCQALTLAGAAPNAEGLEALIALESRTFNGVDPAPIGGSSAPPPSETSVAHKPPGSHDPTKVRLREAAIELLTATSGKASLRDIAAKAGVTTGAVYRRYESKDELIADVVQARVTQERTTWAQYFFEALMSGTKGDPASVLAKILAHAAEPNSINSRESIEIIVAARSGPAARAALAARFTQAVATRTEQLKAFEQAGLMRYPDSCVGLSWAFQVAPTGARVLGLAVDTPDAEGWRPSMVALLEAL